MTSYCPTVITSPQSTYTSALPHLHPRPGNAADGAEVLGAHLEGPFISRIKKGAHLIECIYDVDAKGPLQLADVEDMYGKEALYSAASIVTLAPELDPDGSVSKLGVKVYI